MQTSSEHTLVQRIALEIWEVVKFLAPIILIVFVVRTYIAQPFIVDGESMSPNFHTGHYLIIDEISYRIKEPKHADVVVLRYPLDPSRFFLKRVIGIPGDTIAIRDGKVYITLAGTEKETLLSEPYQQQSTFPINPTYRKITLGEDEYFVMGDNRGGSDDSRSWGILPRENITGRVLLRLFPLKSIGITPASIDDFGQK